MASHQYVAPHYHLSPGLFPPSSTPLLTSFTLSVLPPQKNEDLLLSQFSKPKQKRHRCRNPNKIDINTLTGEERVPVVNRRNGRKVSQATRPLLCC